MATLFLLLYMFYLLTKDLVQGASGILHHSEQDNATKNAKEITLDNVIFYDILDDDCDDD